MKAHSGMAACGIMAVLAITGCGSGGSGGGGTIPGVTPVVTANGATGAAVSTSGGSSTLPSWAAGLGPGVTIEDPPSFSGPAPGTPQASVNSYIDALTSTDPGADCDYVEPAGQSTCLGQVQADGSEPDGNAPTPIFTAEAFATGYAAIDGNYALVDVTFAEFCTTQTLGCFIPNGDPAALLDSGASFAALWSQVSSNKNGNVLELVRCINVNGTWYVYIQPESK